MFPVKFSRPVLATQIFLNALMLVGPLMLGWSINALMMVYWLEVVIVGLLILPKMMLASDKGTLGKSKTYQAIFYFTHYSSFCVIYFVVLGVLLPEGDGWSVAEQLGVMAGMLLLAGGHLYSLGVNYWLGKEYEGASSQFLMVVPYARVLPMQVLVLAAVLLMRGGGLSEMELGVIVGVKIAGDIMGHLLERRLLARG